MPAIINPDKCIGCGICEKNCPGDLIILQTETSKAIIAYPDECWYCGACRLDCSENAIEIIFPFEIL